MRIDCFIRLFADCIFVDKHFNQVELKSINSDINVEQFYIQNGSIVGVVSNRRIFLEDSRNIPTIQNISNMIRNQKGGFILNKGGLREYRQFYLLPSSEKGLYVKSLCVTKYNQEDLLEVVI